MTRLAARLWGSAEARADTLLALFVLGLAALVLQEAARLPPPFFDPLGPAAVPRLLARALIVLALLLLLRRLLLAPAPTPAAETGPAPAPLLALASVAVTVLYVLAMQLRWLGFLEATFLYLLAFGVLLGGLERRLLALLAVTALVVAIGFDLVFTRFFFIDLPRPRLL